MPQSEQPPDFPIRLNKYVAHSGICSRRKADEYIQRGHVSVNGEVVKNPAHRVQEGDKVSFKGKPIRREKRKVYLLLNKPKNVITTVQDEKGRKTVLDLIGPEIRERVYPVGRLDRDTLGLLLLTNDGDLSQKLAHPRYEIKKVYQVVLDKALLKEDLKKIAGGLELEDGPVKVDAINYLVGKPKNEVGVEIHIGRNRIVRRIFEHLGYEVRKLDRTYYGGLTKKDIPRGRYRHLTKREIIMLKHFV